MATCKRTDCPVYNNGCLYNQIGCTDEHYAELSIGASLMLPGPVQELEILQTWEFSHGDL